VKDLKATVSMNIEITNQEILSKIDTICTELSLSLDQFIIYSIDKLLYDIQFVHNLRLYKNQNQ
jgi:hypothetical protein